jgi:assimilatory nitrate reductase catalytic subunit
MLSFALDQPAAGWPAWLDSALPEGKRIGYADPGAGIYRTAIEKDGRLEAILFVGPSPDLPSPDWLKSQFAQPGPTPAIRRALLAGRPSEGAADEGPIVCVCFQVGASRIAATAAAGDGTLEKIGRRLGAGTNCGSCIPEIRRLIAAKEADRAPA